MLWKITYWYVDNKTMKYNWKTMYFTNNKTFFDVEKYLKKNNIFKYKLDVISKDDVEDEDFEKIIEF